MSLDIAKRKAFLIKLIREKERAMERAPEGYLRVTMSHGAPRYYHVQNTGQPSGTYLGKKKLRLTKRLAQKSYDKEVLNAAIQELKALETYEKKMPEHSAEDVFQTLTPARQELIVPLEPTDQEFLKAWTSVEWDKDWFPGEKPSYPTVRGELTRSRIEGLIADLLYRNGWYYRYEYPIRLKVDGREKEYHPDFTILDLKNRKEYLLEHFGMLHKENYRKQMIEKIETYQENGYKEGFNIIYTFESDEKPLDLLRLERYLKKLLG